MITNGAAMRQIAATSRDWYRITNKADAAPEVFIYGEIGWDGITADDLVRDLAGIDADAINVRINSPGGSVFGGIAIYNALRTHPATVNVIVDSMAASVASVIAQAGDTRVMVQHSQMMIHEAQGIAIGSGEEIRSYAALLDKQSDLIANVYAERSGKPEAIFRALMNSETFFTAEEAVETGLADEVLIPRKQEEPVAEMVTEPPVAVTVEPEQVLEPTEDIETPEPPRRVASFGDDPFEINPFTDLA